MAPAAHDRRIDGGRRRSVLTRADLPRAPFPATPVAVVDPAIAFHRGDVRRPRSTPSGPRGRAALAGAAITPRAVNSSIRASAPAPRRERDLSQMRARAREHCGLARVVCRIASRAIHTVLFSADPRLAMQAEQAAPASTPSTPREPPTASQSCARANTVLGEKARRSLAPLRCAARERARELARVAPRQLAVEMQSSKPGATVNPCARPGPIATERLFWRGATVDSPSPAA